MADREPHDDEERPDWVERLSSLAGMLGFNRVQVRWRLDRLRQRWRDKRERTSQRVEQIRYEHKVCPECGRVNDSKDKVCDKCGTVLGARGWHVLQRIGVSLPDFLSISSILGVVIVVVFARMAIFEGGPDSIWAFQIETLYRFGGHYPPSVWDGEWWRLVTSIFMHLGIWHIGFNLFALSQIGPPVEELFGRGRMLLFFMLTGLVANLGSEAFGLQGVAIGASGAIMGLCGLAAGWGQRDGTTHGRTVRNLMLKWGVYTVLFGFFIGADNAAHVVGFLAGGVIGFAARPDQLKRSDRLWLRLGQGIVGGLIAVVAIVYVLLPPPSDLPERLKGMTDIDGYDGQAVMREWHAICNQHRAGHTGDALARAIELMPAELEPDLGFEMNREYLDAVCQGFDAQRQQCERFGSEGLDAMLPDLGEQLDGHQRIEYERHYQIFCSELLGKPVRPPARITDAAVDPETAPEPEVDDPYGKHEEVCEAYRRGDVDRARGRLQELFAAAGHDLVPDKDMLASLCDAGDDLQVRCRRLRAGGLAEFYPESAIPPGETERAKLERRSRTLCTLIGE